ncbi:MAG: ACP S-malonyltransferase [Cuspidothrix sp.]|jgi:malonyl CoA-acyl carrier protein transacylase
MITYLFPGQGSQISGMGQELFTIFPEETEIASDMLGYSIIELCTEDPHNQLNQTQFTQPAVFIVNALSYKLRLAESGKLPNFLVGHSLGEYNALHASGAFSFEDGIRLVTKRGELMSRASKGGMGAVIGMSPSDIRTILDSHGLSGVYIANYNSPHQTVVSGLQADIEKSNQVLVDKGAVFVLLNTSGAFHSPYMVAAKEEFAQYLKNFSFSNLTIPVICNVNARPYRQAEIASQLADQIASPVLWSNSISYLLSQDDQMQFEELGVGNILTKLIPSIRKEYQVQQEDIPQNKNIQTYRQVDPSLSSQFWKKDTPANPEGSSQFQTQFTVDREHLASEARTKVDRWNRVYPVGTKVKIPGSDLELTTSTPAVILFRHRAAVYMQDYNGYFALDEILPIR